MIDDLTRAGFRGTSKAEAPLAPFTTWRIGGPAEILVTPADADDLALVVAWAARAGLPLRILGNGSNLLVADAGVRGVVVRLRRTLDEVDPDGERLTVGAGASYPAVARLACRRGWSGLEFATGIPGTVGGAIVMNAGWHEHETSNLVEAVDVLERGELRRLSAEACAFGYRTSAFRDGEAIVTAAHFRIEHDDPARIRERLDAFAASRKANQPTDQPSCGSVFIQPPGDYAGRLIDAAGLKGTREGAIEVSPLHANFFVNHGGGSSAEVLRLVERVERVVAERFDVALTREFELWSDSNVVR